MLRAAAWLSIIILQREKRLQNNLAQHHLAQKLIKAKGKTLITIIRAEIIHNS